MTKPSSRDLPPPPLPFDSPNSLRRSKATRSSTPEPAPSVALPRLASPLPTISQAHQGRFSVLATSRDGTMYPGDMIRDTIRYRILRADSLRKELGPDSAAELARLETSLRRAPSQGSAQEELDKLRAFQRYNCAYTSAIHFKDPNDHSLIMCMPVMIGDISAGGVKICGAHTFEPGLAVVLHIRDTGPECSEVQLPSRIAWTTESAFGLMFAGPPTIVGAVARKDLAA